ncbi:unnamed protein product [Vitrella brassicaformis CCMP3155]|uniref:Uncharacterized protein n=1 Tax=Vitrella brassicaformis (strain CCMP3155) TaxID=1169540 RepID=A0A0G4GVZ4_VITBC|nr:unnamed protein product [Vitrella brassicaformis CCMP3155]|eukprot:CEM34853.1 unnamed protein product [Vitrella brassicaformis CCMP3155]
MKRTVSLLHPNVSPPLAEPTNATADSLARPKVKRHRPTTLFAALERDIQQGHIGADLPTNSTALPVCGSDMMPRLVDSLPCKAVDESLCVDVGALCWSNVAPLSIAELAGLDHTQVSVSRVRPSSSEWRQLEVDLQHTTLINIPQHEHTVCAEREAAADDELAREVCAAMANLKIVTSGRMFWALSIVQSLRIPD